MASEWRETGFFCVGMRPLFLPQKHHHGSRKPSAKGEANAALSLNVRGREDGRLVSEGIQLRLERERKRDRTVGVGQ